MEMDIPALVTGCVVLFGILLILFRAFLGPSSFDRILAVNAMGTKTVIFVVLLGFITQRPDFLDIAIVYALINFVVTIGLLKFVEYGRLG